MKLGIDFGTTRTVVACADRGNYPVVSFFDVDGDAHDYYPSVVAERAGELRFGWNAVAVAEDPSYSVVRSFKRLLAGPDAVPQRPMRVGTTTLALGEVIHRFVASLRDALLTRSNMSGPTGAIRSVVGVPANAFGAQRFVTLDAFRRAGLAPVAMLNEPSAAGFEYTHRHRDTLTEKRDQVVVYDLGGGTFDASLVRMRGRHHEVLATAGVNRLGGDDFDEVLVGLVLAKAGGSRAELAPRELERLTDQCRDAKERLNPSSRKMVFEVGAREVTVPVAEFYEACEPLVTCSIEAMVPVMTQLSDEAAQATGVPDEIAGIYVVGGASELPIVGRALRARFGRRTHRSPYPGAAIAIGLAIACDGDARFELADCYSRTFGVFREGRAGSEIIFDPIFPSGTQLPTAASTPVRRRRHYRAAHNLGHFRFFECEGVSEGGHPSGDIMVSGDVLFPFDRSLAEGESLEQVEVERMAEGPRIEEEYALDESGIVAVTIRNVDQGYERVYRLGA